MWYPATTPSTVGWVTEVFGALPGTVRSDHYSHSVAARGRGAARLVADHRRQEGPMADCRLHAIAEYVDALLA